MAAVPGETSTLTISTVPTANASTEILSPYLPIVFEVTTTELSVLTKFVQAEIQYGSGNTSIATIKKELITVSGSDLFRFEISNLLQTILESELLTMATSSTIQTGGTNVANTFRVVFTQIYIDDFGNVIEQATTVSSNYWVGNSTVQYDNSNQNLTEYILTGTGNTFLTNIPNNSDLWENDVMQLTFYVPNSTDSYAMYYEEYNLSGIAQGTTTTTAKTVDNRYAIAPINTTEVLSNFANMSKVDVWIYNTTTSARVSEKKTFTIKQGICSGTRIMWMNTLGGIDQYTFRNGKERGNLFSSQQIEKALLLSYDRNSRGTTTISSQSLERWAVSSGYLTEDYLQWLNEILTSTDVWLLHSVNVRTPIIPNVEETISFSNNNLSDFNLSFAFSRKRINHIG